MHNAVPPLAPASTHYHSYMRTCTREARGSVRVLKSLVESVRCRSLLQERERGDQKKKANRFVLSTAHP